MADQSPNLLLPWLAAAQAQKHVTVNEALKRLDAVVQISVKARTITAPPLDAVDGARWIVPAAATAEWAGQQGRIAAFQDGVWEFYDPRPGWTVWVQAEGRLILRRASDWVLVTKGAVV